MYRSTFRTLTRIASVAAGLEAVSIAVNGLGAGAVVPALVSRDGLAARRAVWRGWGAARRRCDGYAERALHCVLSG